MADSARRHVAAQIGVIQRHCGPDDSRLPELRRVLALARVEERVRAAVESAPPLPADLRTRLVELIRSASSVVPQPKPATRIRRLSTEDKAA